MTDDPPRRNKGPVSPLLHLAQVLNRYDQMWLRTVNSLIAINNALADTKAVPETAMEDITNEMKALIEVYEDYQEFKKTLIKESEVRDA